MAAAAGGFTAVACMANTDPVNDSRSVTEHILLEARRHGFARVYPIGAISKGLLGEELAEIGEMVRAGVRAVSDDGKPVMNAELMRRALFYARHFDIPVIQHAEDLNLTGKGVMHEGEWSTKLGLPGIPGVGRGRDGGARHHPRRGHGRPLPRGPPLDGPQPRPGAPGPGPGPPRHLRGGAPPPDPHGRGGRQDAASRPPPR